MKKKIVFFSISGYCELSKSELFYKNRRGKNSIKIQLFFHTARLKAYELFPLIIVITRHIRKQLFSFESDINDYITSSLRHVCGECRTFSAFTS